MMFLWIALISCTTTLAIWILDTQHSVKTLEKKITILELHIETLNTKMEVIKNETYDGT